MRRYGAARGAQLIASSLTAVVPQALRLKGLRIHYGSTYHSGKQISPNAVSLCRNRVTLCRNRTLHLIHAVES